MIKELDLALKLMDSTLTCWFSSDCGTAKGVSPFVASGKMEKEEYGCVCCYWDICAQELAPFNVTLYSVQHYKYQYLSLYVTMIVISGSLHEKQKIRRFRRLVISNSAHTKIIL